MKLKCILIADPKVGTAELVGEQCERLAENRVIANAADQTLSLAKELNPNMLLLSLELPGMTPKKFVPTLIQAVPETFLIATYRELSVRDMEQLGGLGVEEFLPHPLDILQVFRAASRRFNLPFRRHDRYAVTLEIYRADGVMVGKSIDISEGGMLMDAIHPVNANESILVDLHLSDEAKPLRVRCHILHVEGKAPTPVRARVQFANLWGPQHVRLIKFLKTQTEVAQAEDQPT